MLFLHSNLFQVYFWLLWRHGILCPFFWRVGYRKRDWNAIINWFLSFIITYNWLYLVIYNNVNFYIFILYTTYLMTTFTNFHMYILNSLGYSRLFISSEYNKFYHLWVRDFVSSLCCLIAKNFYNKVKC